MSKRAVQLDEDTDAILRRLAQERAAEPEAIVSDAVRLFDDLYGQAALGELDRRWAGFERIGESYTQDEVEAWLKTWRTRDFRPFRSNRLVASCYRRPAAERFLHNVTTRLQPKFPR